MIGAWNPFPKLQHFDVWEQNSQFSSLQKKTTAIKIKQSKEMRKYEAISNI